MQTLDAFQQTLDAVMKKTGDLNDVEDEAEKLLETMDGHNAALTKILLESPANVLQDVEQVVDFGNLDQQAVWGMDFWNLEQQMAWENFEEAFQQGYWPNLQQVVAAGMLQNFRCHVCNIDLASNDTLRAHMAGVRHIKRALLLRNAQAGN